tara:strand:+ start:300 stop:467 length:168 start_codon:yes stop_codon:yes gene_type:complete
MKPPTKSDTPRTDALVSRATNIDHESELDALQKLAEKLERENNELRKELEYKFKP